MNGLTSAHWQLLRQMQVLEDNARALATGSQMPYARTAGTISTPDNVSGTALRQVMPRDHA